MPGNTLQITAVAAIGTGSLGAFGQSWHGIVVRVPVGEAIGSHQINHIPRRKTLALGRTGFTRFKLVFDGFPAPSSGQRQGHPAGRQLSVQAQRNKQVAGVIQAVGLNHLHPPISAAHRAAGQILAINHQLQLPMPHARPPERRLNPLDRAGISRARGDHGIDRQYYHGARPFTATPLLCCVHRGHPLRRPPGVSHYPLLIATEAKQGKLEFIAGAKQIAGAVFFVVDDLAGVVFAVVSNKRLVA